MSEFHYRNGILHAEDLPLVELARQYGTPAWIYSAAALTRRYREFETAFKGINATICYALKANGNQAVIATFAALGAGADIVSGGELKRALAAGVPASKIVFAGVGKTAAEMEAALDAGIMQFNVESEPELRMLSRVASARGKTAPVVLRINPDIDAKTHAKITTGKSENKFGIEIAHASEVADLAATLPAIELIGLSTHIGSQLTSVDPFSAAFARLAALARDMRARGYKIRRLDFGGGIGVPYNGETPPDLTLYAAAVRAAIAGLDVDVVIEPGRALVAEAGILLSRVIYMKSGTTKRFAIIDAAMNDLLRPAMYDAYHPMRPVKEPAPGAALVTVDVVGPVCETGDRLAQDRPLPPLADGDLIAIFMAGAYGAVMSSAYNSRPLAPEILVNGRQSALVRPRQSVDELIAADALPPWLDTPRGARVRSAG